MRLLARSLTGVLAAVGVAALAGCSLPAHLGGEAAKDAVDHLLAPPAFHSYADDIVQFAERVDAATEYGPVVMLGVEEADEEDLDSRARKPIGWITLGLTVSDTRASHGFWGAPTAQDPGPHCFRVTFDNWGVKDVDGEDGPSEELVAVPPPPSQRPRIAPNAETAVWSALTALPEELPSEAEVVAAVTGRLEPHPNGVTPLAPVTASIEGGAVAVATGDDDDCVLVVRTDSGEVRDVHVPSIYLKRGELGCRATTAFADLRPPH
ncbi:hypothetical protein [Georgenia sp. Marseille-Q6866]